MKNTAIYSLLLVLFLGSCSIVKQPTSSNFKRVKYNAHLKKGKSYEKKKLAKTASYAEEKEAVKEKSKVESIANATKVQSGTKKKHKKDVLFSDKIKSKKVIISKPLEVLLEEAVQSKEAESEESLNTTPRDWWEDDPEDWPWGEIVLAVIAILLIAILIVILIDIIGAIIGSILGLILLILLAYLLYQYWV